MQPRRAVAFTGPSNSGKTTLIVKVAQKLIHDHGLQVAIIKHDPKDKAHFDIPGKDSYRFSNTGAEVVVTSPRRTTYFSQRQQSLEEIITMVGDFDLLLVEGLKNLPLPRICIFRGRIDEEYFPYMDALAIDESVALEHYQIPLHISVLDLNDEAAVIEWIFQHAKEV